MLKRRELDELSGTTKKITGNMDEKYSFPEHEGNLVHLMLILHADGALEKSGFVEENGTFFEKKEMPKKIMKTSSQRYMSMKERGAFKSYHAVHLLHDPNKK